MKVRITIPGKIVLFSLAYELSVNSETPIKACYQDYKKFIINDAGNQPIKLGKSIFVSITYGKSNYKIYIKRRFNRIEKLIFKNKN